MIDEDTFKKMIVTHRLSMTAQYVDRIENKAYYVFRLYHDTVRVSDMYLSEWRLKDGKLDGKLDVKNEQVDMAHAQEVLDEYQKHVQYIQRDRRGAHAQVDEAFSRAYAGGTSRAEYSFWNVYRNAIRYALDDARFTVKY